MRMFDSGSSPRRVAIAIAVAAAGCRGATSAADGPSAATQDSTSTAGAAAGDVAAGTVQVSGFTTSVPEPELDEEAWSKSWRLLSLPAASTFGSSVIATPTGWIAVSSRIDNSKAPVAPESFIYRSLDGIHWRAMSTGTADAKLESAQVAYGRGRYIITGSRAGRKVVLDSSDGETWRELVLDDPNPWSNGPVKYVQDRFFLLNASFWGSPDGQQWSLLDQPYPYAGLNDIAYGNSRYLGVGSDTLLSVDGTVWRSAPIKTLEGAAVASPFSLFFAEGQFHVLPDGVPDGGFSSPDGESWQFTRAFIPDAYVAGHFVRLFDAQRRVWFASDEPPRSMDVITRPSMLPPGVTAADWSTDGSADAFPKDEPMPADLDFSWRDGLDCNHARCLVVTSGNQSRLFLVP